MMVSYELPAASGGLGRLLSNPHAQVGHNEG